MLKFPESFRVTPTSPFAKKVNPLMHTLNGSGDGVFMIELSTFVTCFCIASSAEGWDHVSVNLKDKRIKGACRTPTWAEMCKIKEFFWEEEDTVIQYHPAKSDYVNVAKFVLHLWRPFDSVLPIPSKIMV